MSRGERLQLWRMGEGRLITVLGQGFPGEEAGVGGPGVGSGMEWRCGGGGVGGGGLHLGTRQEMKKCSDWEKELRTAPSFLLRHQLSWALK